MSQPNTISVAVGRARSWIGVPDPGVERVFYSNTLISSFGYGLYASVSSLFLLKVVGYAPSMVGTVLTASLVVGIVFNPVVGRACDYIGARKVYLASAAVQAVSMLLLAFPLGITPAWLALLILGLAETTGSVGRGALLPALVSRERRVILSAHLRSGFNLGFCLATLVASAALAVNSELLYRIIIAFDALTALIVMAQIHWRLPAGDARRSSSPAAARGSWRRAQRYVLFAFSSGVATWSDYIMFIGFPLVFARTASLPVWLVPIVIFSNTAIVILCQVQVARWVDARRDPRPLLSAGFLVFSACVAAMATFYLGVNKWVLVACLLLITVFVTGVELVVESVRWKIRYDLAPDHAQGLYSGYFNLGDSVAKAVGPIVIGSALGVWREFGWIGLAVTVFCAGVVARASAVQRSPVAEKPPAAEVSGVRADTWEATT